MTHDTGFTNEFLPVRAKEQRNCVVVLVDFAIHELKGLPDGDLAIIGYRVQTIV